MIWFRADPHAAFRDWSTKSASAKSKRLRLISIAPPLTPVYASDSALSSVRLVPGLPAPALIGKISCRQVIAGVPSEPPVIRRQSPVLSLFVSKTVLQGQLDQTRGDRGLVNHPKLSSWGACARARKRVAAGAGEYGIVVYDLGRLAWRIGQD